MAMVFLDALASLDLKLSLNESVTWPGWLVFMVFRDIFVDLHGFWLFFMIFHFFFKIKPALTLRFFFAKSSGPRFLRCFIDNNMQLFPLFTNHRSSDAIFAMYRNVYRTPLNFFLF